MYLIYIKVNIRVQGGRRERRSEDIFSYLINTYPKSCCITVHNKTQKFLLYKINPI